MPASTTDPGALVAGNVYDKYGTRNPLYRRLMAGFLASARDLLDGVELSRVLEVGCGPGDLARRLWPALEMGGAAPRYLGLDLGYEEAIAAARSLRGGRALVAAAERLPVGDGSVDCVIACEVLEHLRQPAAALEEIARVCAGAALISVPWEPVWRLLNIARGAYLGALGNTPGHLQHFSRHRLRRLVSVRFEILAERRPFPWTMLLVRPRPSPGPP